MLEAVGVAEELPVDVAVFTGAAMPVGSVSGVEEDVVATEESAGEELAVEVKVFTGAAIPDGSTPVVVDDEVLAEVAVSTGAAVAVGDVLVVEAPSLDEEVLGVVDEEIPEVADEEVELLDEDGSIETEVPTGATIPVGSVALVVFVATPVERLAGMVLLIGTTPVGKDVSTGAAMPDGWVVLVVEFEGAIVLVGAVEGVFMFVGTLMPAGSVELVDGVALAGCVELEVMPVGEPVPAGCVELVATPVGSIVAAACVVLLATPVGLIVPADCVALLVAFEETPVPIGCVPLVVVELAAVPWSCLRTCSACAPRLPWVYSPPLSECVRPSTTRDW